MVSGALPQVTSAPTIATGAWLTGVGGIAVSTIRAKGLFTALRLAREKKQRR